jgi:hypothetical protein
VDKVTEISADSVVLAYRAKRLEEGIAKANLPGSLAGTLCVVETLLRSRSSQ